MKNKGFTLIELLAVLCVLSIIMVIVVPKVTDATKSAKDKAYNDQIDVLISAAKKWGASNTEKLSVDKKVAVTFKTLFEDGYIKESKVINPKTKKELEGCIRISYDEEYQQYKYEYTINNAFCEVN